MAGEFLEAFRSVASESLRAQEDAITPILEVKWTEAQSKWSFKAKLATWIERALLGHADGALEGLRGEDLYLTVAATEGNKEALVAFDRALRRVVESTKLPRETERDELTQTVRERLLVPRPTEPARLTQYKGRGPLDAWLRVTALRTALSEKKANPAQSDREVELEAVGANPELAVLRDRYAVQLDNAFRKALGSLSAEERNILRLQLIDRASIDDLAKILGVHRATAARRASRARENVLAATRENLGIALGANANDVDSLIHVLVSRLDVSVAKALDLDPDE